MDMIYKIEHETRNINLDTRDFYSGLYEFFSESYTRNRIEAFNEGYKEGYKEGYGTYDGHTLLDTGLSLKEATEICKELNNKLVKEKA